MIGGTRTGLGIKWIEVALPWIAEVLLWIEVAIKTAQWIEVAIKTAQWIVEDTLIAVPEDIPIADPQQIAGDSLEEWTVVLPYREGETAIPVVTTAATTADRDINGWFFALSTASNSCDVH